MTIVDLLTAFAGAAVTYRRDDPEIAAVTLIFPDGRRMILLERTYRSGIVAIANATDGDLRVLQAQSSDLRELWNSGCGEWIGGIGATPEHLFEPVASSDEA